MAVERIFDLIGGINTATNWLTRKSNEVEDAENVRFNDEVGSATRRPGYTRRLTSGTNEEALGFHEAKFDTGAITFTASDNGTNTVIKAIDSVGTVTTVISDLPRHTKCQFLDHLNEVYVAGITTDTRARIQVRNIRMVAGVPTVSLIRNLITAPKAAFVGENSGKMYLLNVEVEGVVYPDRAYESSPPMGAITYIKGDQNNVYAPVTLVNQIPLMTSNTVPSGVASASTALANAAAFGAFDRTTTLTTTDTRWLTSPSGTLTGWLRYDFGSGNAKVITHYAVSAAGPTLNRAPKTWTFEGSNNGSTWTTLQTVTNEPAFTVIGETRTYPTSNTTAYQYYRINVSVNQGATDYVAIAELSMYTALQGSTRYRQSAVDSVRYIKAGMELEVYAKGTENKIADIVVDSVNNADDTFNFLPFSQTLTSVTAGSDYVTVTAGSANYPLGTPVVFNSTGTVPGGLTADVTYYSIPFGTDTIRLANSYDLATVGNYIDITSAGTGTITISKSYVFSDNDEIWLKGRKADLSVLWNTDYRTPQTSDFLRIPSGSASDTSITGWVKSNNRLQIFTPTSTHQYDGANFLPIFEDIGCISHDTIQNSGPWVIWLDATGKVRARDSTSGQDEIISRFIKNRFLDTVPDANLALASSSMYDGVYKLNLGQVGTKYMRMVYNFDTNTWWRESHVRNLKYSITSRLSGKDRLYWLSDGLAIYLDEEGDLDYDSTIPMKLQYGRRHMGSAYKKAGVGLYVYGENISSAKIDIKLPGKANDWMYLGQLTEPISRIVVGDKKVVEARDFDIRISHHAKGEAPRIDGIEFHYNQLEENFG
jgi:hypothetical protein